MVDLGIRSGSEKSFGDEDYEVKYLSQLEIDDEITGEIYLGDIKSSEIKGKEIQQFYVILTDHENKQKWICGLISSVYFNEDATMVYGEKGGRVYELIDSLNHALNDTPLNEKESYSVVFDTFRETVNEKVGNVTVKAVQPSNPNAKTPNLNVIKAEDISD